MLNLQIITPEGSVYESDEVTSITVPTSAGVLGIYEGHESLMSVLAPGELNIEKDDHKVDMVISSGVMKIQQPGDTVCLLVETAENVADIDLERAEAARQRAEQYLSQTQDDIDDEEFARIQSQLLKELARIDAASRYRRNN